MQIGDPDPRATRSAALICSRGGNGVRNLLKSGAALLLALTVLFATYEAYALARARAHTPAVLVRAGQGELRLDDLSPARLHALLAVEDPGFARHHGIDFTTPGQGMTTLTQALVKIFYFHHFRPGFAKIEQSLIARFVLDPAMAKPEQVHALLNHANFGTWDGRPVIGFVAAARTYFVRSFAALSDRQFLSLVAMLMAPNRLDPLRHPAANAERVRRIERLLAGRCRPDGLNDVAYRRC